MGRRRLRSWLERPTVRVWTEGERLRATVSSTASEEKVSLSAYVPGLSNCNDGGVDINHTGTAGDNAVYLTSVTTGWFQRMPLFLSDMDSAAWCYDAASWAVKAGRMDVNDLRAFEPDRVCTWGEAADAMDNNFGSSDPQRPISRADALEQLWLLCDRPEPTATQHPFTDVPAGADYAKALLWAAEKGITTGTTPTTFEPDRLCTRGELAAFLHRALAD